MSSPVPRCRGFTHPFVLLVQNTLGMRGIVRLRSSARNPTVSSHLFITNPVRSPRTFSSCRVLYDSINKKPQMPPTSAKPSGAPSNVSDHLSRISYAQRLAMKPTPTMLYEAASQSWFLASSYSAAFFCFCSAVVNSYFNVMTIPPDVASFVPIGFSVVSFMFAVIGTTFALRPSSVIRSIRLMGDPALPHTPGTLPKRVVLEVVARRIAPLPSARMIVPIESFVLVNRMLWRPRVLTPEEQMAQKLENARLAKEHREYEMDHILTSPFRDAGRVSTRIFVNIRRGLTGEGFSPVYINGVRYKMDVEGGYSLEDGRALDRIVRIQPDPTLAITQSKVETRQAS